MNIVITGAGGFIGSHLGRWFMDHTDHLVTGVDLVEPQHMDARAVANEFQHADMRDPYQAKFVLRKADLVFALAANMGGMGFIGNKANDLDVLVDNALINLNTVRALALFGRAKHVVFSSSACVYNETLQDEVGAPPLSEGDAYPAQPDTVYGWEKLFGEIVYQALGRRGMTMAHIVRFHNIYGPEGTWQGGREKAPAALCRKVAEAKRDGGREIEIWGDGEQTRSFCYIDDCVRGLVALSESDLVEPVNLGTSRDVSINELADIIMRVAGFDGTKKHVEGIQGVRGRNADLSMIAERLGWVPEVGLERGLEYTYRWIEDQVVSCNYT